MTDPVTRYADAVLAGEIVAGPYVRVACARHRRDIEREDLVFDEGAARRVIEFFSDVLHLSAGEHEGQPFVLLPWQQFVVGSLHGWKRADGLRRFRKAYIETAKGSGKTPLAGGLALYSICADGEPRAEAYVTARTADQALVTFRPVAAMVEQSPALAARLRVFGGRDTPYNIAHHESMSFARRISSDKQGKGKSGPLPHMIVCDEYHEHETSAMLEFLDAGTKNRRQPFTVVITNAGAGRGSPCGQEHDYAVRVAKGTAEDDEYFAYVCALDDGDDPFKDESCWVKSNPSLPLIPGHDYIRRQVAKARGMPSKQSLVERLNFCVWTDAESPWLSREMWTPIEVETLPAEIEAAPCYAGLDLALKADLTAGALVWDLSDGNEKRYAAKVRVWTPLDTIRQRADRDSVPYPEWAEAGHLIAVQGSVMDYAWVVQWLSEAMDAYDLRGVAYDPHKVDLLEAELDKAGILTTRNVGDAGLLLAPHPQGFLAGPGARGQADPLRTPLYMPRSIDATEEAILERRIQVEINYALRWAADGAVVVEDNSNNRRFAKKKALSKIDAIVALTMAMGFATAQLPEAANPLLKHYQSGQPLEAWSV